MGHSDLTYNDVICHANLKTLAKTDKNLLKVLKILCKITEPSNKSHSNLQKLLVIWHVKLRNHANNNEN